MEELLDRLVLAYSVEKLDVEMILLHRHFRHQCFLRVDSDP